jgi:hypothetical protein
MRVSWKLGGRRRCVEALKVVAPARIQLHFVAGACSIGAFRQGLCHLREHLTYWHVESLWKGPYSRRVVQSVAVALAGRSHCWRPFRHDMICSQSLKDGGVLYGTNLD